MEPTRQAIKVYLEDTDAQGIVYHANFLKYFERSRTDLLESFGIRQSEGAVAEIRFVVHEMHLKFLKPARLGDQLEVWTQAARASEFRLSFRQEIRRAGESPLLVSAEVFVVCIGKDGALVEIPPEVSL